jgi:Uma2 family endonuclease
LARTRWTSADLEVLPFDDGKRYEIVDGELYVSKAPSNRHQLICALIWSELDPRAKGQWGGWAFVAPGLIFSEDEDVIPDVIWVSGERLPVIQGADGHFHGAPELVVEVLSPGPNNERRDREVKRQLYSRQGVREYWLVDPERRELAVFRHKEGALALAATLLETDTLTSPQFPSLAVDIGALLPDLPAAIT